MQERNKTADNNFKAQTLTGHLSGKWSEVTTSLTFGFHGHSIHVPMDDFRKCKSELGVSQFHSPSIDRLLGDVYHRKLTVYGPSQASLRVS